jgi:hypothetical protein
MVMPRSSTWTVSATKPSDHQKFDSLAQQKLRELREGLGYTRPGNTSEMVYEVFATEQEARDYAIYIEQFGATDISVSPPRAAQNGG